MKHFYLKFTKKTVIHLFLGMSLLLGSQGMWAAGTFTTTATGGDWSNSATWVGGIAPPAVPGSNDLIIINGDVTLTLTAANTVKTTVSLLDRYTFSMGYLNIASGKTLSVTSDNATTTFNYYFNIGNLNIAGVYSTISGALNFDATIKGGKTVSNLTVAAGGSILENQKVSISLSGATSILTNYGTITTGTLAPASVGMKIENYGTLSSTGFSTATLGTLTNYAGGIYNHAGTIAGNIKNYGIVNATGLSGTAGTATFTNYNGGVLNFTGNAGFTSTNLVFTATEAGNTVNYSLAAAQTIQPTSYYNLILSGSGIKNVAATKTVTIVSGGLLTVNEGIFLNNSGTITNNGDILLKSSATGSGSLVSTSSINNVTQQRYLSSVQRGWRLLSNPLASTTFNTLATASGITIGTNYTGEYLSPSNTWTSTDGSAAMDTQKAYKVFITGLTGEAPTYATGPSNVTLVNKGTAANTAPATINTVAGEFYLVANPYTAPVSVARVLSASTGLSTTVGYYNPTNGSTDPKVKFGGYDTTTATGAAGSATDVVIPAMGAIFVQAATAGTINVPASTVFTGTVLGGSYNHKTAQTKVASTNALKVEVISDGVYYDALAFQFKAVGDAGSNIDFGKLPNSILDAYSFAGSNKMAVSELELVAQTIPLGITSTIQKNYTFKVVDNTIPAGFEAVLVDNLLNTSTVLTAGTNYNFTIDSTPASQGDARFAINLRTAGSLGVIANELEASIQVYPNPSRGQFNIANTLDQKEDATIEISSLNGQVIHTQKLNSGTTTIQTKSWATGVYILKATNNGNQTTKKLIIQ